MNVPSGETRIGWIAFFDWLARVGRAVQRSGATADRPDKGTWPGMPYYDVTLDAPVWRNAANTGWVTGTTGGSGTSDHGALTGLADDDHPQYLNETRGDLRYSQLGHTHSYLTQATADGLYAALAHSHSGLVPSGGATGQVLAKNSATSFDMSWQTISSGGSAWDFDEGASGASYSFGALDLEEGPA